MPKEVSLIIGLPGSGKSTLTQFLKKEEIDIVSSSSLLEILTETESNLLKEKYINKGIDIPDDIYVKMIINYIEKSNKKKFAIEGFPYNLNQRALAETSFKKKNILISSVVYLNISKESAISRILNRRVCPICHRTFSNNQSVCNNCEVETEIRKDDKRDIAIERINNLSLFLDEIVDYYKKTKKLIEFDEKESDVNTFFEKYDLNDLFPSVTLSNHIGLNL